MNAINLKRDWMFIISAILLFVYAFSYPVLKLWMFCLPFGVFVIYSMVKNKTLYFDNKCLILVIVMMHIVIHDMPYNLDGEVFKFFAPIVAYLFGKAILRGSDKRIDNKILYLIIALATGCTTQGILDVVIKIASGNIHEAGWIGLWGIYMVRTAYESNFLLLLAITAFLVVTYKRCGNYKKIIIAIGVLSLINSIIIMQGRTNVMIFIVVLVLLYILKYMQQNNYKKNGILLVSVAIVGGIAFSVYEKLLNVYMAHHNGEDEVFFLFRDGGIFHNIRFEVAKQGLKLLIENPNGGFITTIDPDITSTHNMWLEYGREFGLIVFVLLVLFLIMILYNIIEIIVRNGELDIPFMFLSLFVTLNTFYMLEPIQSISDSSQFVLIFFVICGMISEYKINIGTYRTN